MNTYSVIKVNKVTKSETKIAKNLLCGQVSGLIGISPGSVIQYADKNQLYKKEFKIVIDGCAERSLDDLEIRWEEMCKAARVLKNGGKIVSKIVNGKKVRYVEGAK